MLKVVLHFLRLRPNSTAIVTPNSVPTSHANIGKRTKSVSGVSFVLNSMNILLKRPCVLTTPANKAPVKKKGRCGMENGAAFAWPRSRTLFQRIVTLGHISLFDNGRHSRCQWRLCSNYLFAGIRETRKPTSLAELSGEKAPRNADRQ